jgi:hypothetical protein
MLDRAPASATVLYGLRTNPVRPRPTTCSERAHGSWRDSMTKNTHLHSEPAQDSARQTIDALRADDGSPRRRLTAFEVAELVGHTTLSRRTT